MQDQDIKKSLSESQNVLEKLEKWEIKEIENVLLKTSEKFNSENNYPVQNRGFILWPLRVALSGKQASASPFELADILGKEKTLKRISDAINLL